MRGMSSIVKDIARITVWLILLYGVYIAFHGHLSPGGGFTGGVIIALAFVLLVLAYGRAEAERRVKEELSHTLEAVGMGLFLIGGIFALIFTGYFLSNWLFLKKLSMPQAAPFELLTSSGVIMPYNLSIALKVGMGLFVMFVALAGLRVSGRVKK